MAAYRCDTEIPRENSSMLASKTLPPRCLRQNSGSAHYYWTLWTRNADHRSLGRLCPGQKTGQRWGVVLVDRGDALLRGGWDSSFHSGSFLSKKIRSPILCESGLTTIAQPLTECWTLSGPKCHTACARTRNSLSRRVNSVKPQCRQTTSFGNTKTAGMSSAFSLGIWMLISAPNSL